MGRPLPGYRVALIGDDDKPAREGEICLALDERPHGAHDRLQGRSGEDGAR